MWKARRLLKSLENARGNGTSMISILIPPGGEQLARTAKMLVDEHGAAANIKSRVNRLSVLSAITSVQHKIKLYKKTPANGLAIYCGSVVQEDGKTKKLTLDFEPWKPITRSMYFCDNRFHVGEIKAMLQDNDTFGFIVVDGRGALFATLQGTSRSVLQKFDVDLPKKHGRGGQSANRFARLGQEARDNFVRKVAETAKSVFIANEKVNVAGIILAGSADLKSVLGKSDLFDQRLQKKVLKSVDVAYGGSSGLNQAINLCAGLLSDVRFVKERDILNNYFDMVGKSVDKVCFELRDTMHALEMGAVESLLCSENLKLTRFVLCKHGKTEEKRVIYLKPGQEENPTHFKDEDAGVQMEILEQSDFVEWLVENYRSFGTTLELLSDSTPEGTQFANAFGGLGGILRYKVDFGILDSYDLEEDGDDDEEKVDLDD